jgi:hypothetical protein
MNETLPRIGQWRQFVELSKVIGNEQELPRH